MTAKEKAKELVDRFNYKNKHYLSLDAKQCALICVDEILKSHYKVLVGVLPSIERHYKEVKEEINKL